MSSVAVAAQDLFVGIAAAVVAAAAAVVMMVVVVALVLVYAKTFGAAAE